MIGTDKFDEMYRQYASAVYRVALSSVSRREIAEEITSEVFLALHQSWEKLEQDQLPAWLFTVARRRAADYWRRHYVERAWEADQREEIAFLQPEFRLEVLLARCQSLKPIHRVCLILRFSQGMSRSEIAEHTGLTEMQIKGHLQYALQLLREQIVPKAHPDRAEELTAG